MNDEGIVSIKLSKLKYRNGDKIIQTFCKIVCRNFESLSKKFSKSYRTHGNLMNDEKFVSLKVLKLKYRRRDQII